MARTKGQTGTTNQTQTEAETSQSGGTTSTRNGATLPETIDVKAIDSFELEAARVRAASRSATAHAEQMTAETEQNASTSVREKQRLDDNIDCDAFLKDWDMTIHTCPHCRRPFGTPERLSKHQAEWISGSCITKEPRYESLPFDESDIEDIVPGADLIVSVDDGKTARRFRVPSQVLATSSNCFRVSFGPTAQFESANEVRRAAIRGNCPANIDLDDNPAAMEVILKILCFRHHEVPTTLEFRSIVDIAIVADKYELDLVLRPWADKWLQPFQSKLLEYGKTESDSNDKMLVADQTQHDWLFISWVFGYQNAFAQITRILSCAGADLSHLCTQTPGSVLEHLQTLRSSRADKLRQCFKSIQSRPEDDHSFCVKTEQETCNILHFGYLLKMIAQHQLDKNETWDGNFADLAASIDGMKHINLWNRQRCNNCAFYGMDYSVNCITCSHASCGWLIGLKDMASTCIKEDLHLNLSDFPSRVERMRLRSPLDSSGNIG